MEEPSSILSNEVLVDILALVHPRAAVPASTRVMTTVIRDTSAIARSWIHYIIFCSPAWNATEAEFLNAEARTFDYHPASRQLTSRLSAFLKSRLLDLSAGLAPIKATHPEAIFKAPYVDWLFSPSGPFGRPIGCDWKYQLDLLCHPAPEGDGDSADDLEPFERPERLHSLSHRRWQLVPDAFQLVIYFARAGHHALCSRTISRLIALLPDLLKSPLPMSRWCQLTLDNRDKVRSLFTALIYDNHDPTMTFAVFLCFLGALDWSLPVIGAVAGAVHACPVAQDFVDWLNNQHGALRALFDTVGACKEPGRVVALLDWLYQHGMHKIHPEIIDPDIDSPFMAPCATTFEVFFELLTKYDVPKVLPAFEKQDGDDELEIERKAEYKERLGDTTCWWATGHGRWEAIETGFAFDLFSERALAKLLLCAAKDGHVARQSQVVAYAKQSTTNQFPDVVYTALLFDIDEPSPHAVRLAIRSHLFDPVDSRIQRILDHLFTWNESQLSTVVFEIQPPFSPSDHASFAHVWLRKLTDKELPTSTLLRQSRVLGRVLGLGLTELVLVTLPVEALAFAATLLVVTNKDLTPEQWVVLDQISAQCRNAVDAGKVACRVSDSGFREVRPAAIDFLKATGNVLVQYKQGRSDPFLSVNRVVFDFGVVMSSMEEDDLIGA